MQLENYDKMQITVEHQQLTKESYFYHKKHSTSLLRQIAVRRK